LVRALLEISGTGDGSVASQMRSVSNNCGRLTIFLLQYFYMWMFRASEIQKRIKTRKFNSVTVPHYPGGSETSTDEAKEKFRIRNYVRMTAKYTWKYKTKTKIFWTN